MIDVLKKKVTKQEERIVSLKAQVDRLRHRTSYWQSKCSYVKDASDEELTKVLAEEGARGKKLEQEISVLEHENIELHEQVQCVLAEAHDKIVSFKDGRYTDEIRACCYELLSLNVGVKNVKSVIESVLRNVAHREIDRLPKKTAIFVI